RTAFPDIPLRPLALVSLADELRSEAGQVLEALASQGVAFKVVSGDNPETVRGTVGHLHSAWARGPVLSGQQLAGAAEPAALIDSNGAFGRVTPDQKALIIQTLPK